MSWNASKIASKIAMHQRVAAIKIQPSIPFLDLSAKQKHRRIFLGFDLEGQFSEPIFPRLGFPFGPGLVLWRGGWGLSTLDRLEVIILIVEVRWSPHPFQHRTTHNTDKHQIIFDF